MVLVQSSLYDGYRRRVAIPLVCKSSLGPVANPRLNPSFRIKGVAVVLHPLETASVACEHVGEFVLSLKSEGQAIADALDELLTRAWG